MNNSKPFLTTAEAAAKTGYAQKTIVDMCREGKIPGVRRVGPLYLIPQNANIERKRTHGKQK